jgi:hypothetical protein
LDLIDKRLDVVGNGLKKLSSFFWRSQGIGGESCFCELESFLELLLGGSMERGGKDLASCGVGHLKGLTAFAASLVPNK